jgi:hypothetical protein
LTSTGGGRRLNRQQSCPRRIAADGVKNVAASKITHAHLRVLAQGAAIQADDL